MLARAEAMDGGGAATATGGNVLPEPDSLCGGRIGCSWCVEALEADLPARVRATCVPSLLLPFRASSACSSADVAGVK